jgi:hypothetical protein
MSKAVHPLAKLRNVVNIKIQFAVAKSKTDGMGSIACPNRAARGRPLESVRWQRFNPFTARAGESTREKVMAKGQARSNKEKKKPKAEWNKKKKGGPNLSPFALTREPTQPGQNPFAKKN